MTAKHLHRRGFTLIEVMVSTVVLVMLMMIITGVTGQTAKIWSGTNAKMDAFRGARIGIDAMNRRLSQATLNIYFDYYNLKNNRFCNTVNPVDSPEIYRRRSELHFISGASRTFLHSVVPDAVTHAVFFQAPLGYTRDAERYGGLDQLLNACGFYIEYGADDQEPGFLKLLTPAPPPRYRYRLMMMLQPAEELLVYGTPANTTMDAKRWLTIPCRENSRTLAENVIALVISCKRPRTPADRDGGTGDYVDVSSSAHQYDYDSRTPPGNTLVQAETSNQLPPMISVTLVAIDEASAARLAVKWGSNRPELVPASLFQDPVQYGRDIEKLKEILDAQEGNSAGNQIRCQYRIFTFEVLMRAAKWSS